MELKNHLKRLKYATQHPVQTLKKIPSKARHFAEKYREKTSEANTSLIEGDRFQLVPLGFLAPALICLLVSINQLNLSSKLSQLNTRNDPNISTMALEAENQSKQFFILLTSFMLSAGLLYAKQNQVNDEKEKQAFELYTQLSRTSEYKIIKESLSNWLIREEIIAKDRQRKAASMVDEVLRKNIFRVSELCRSSDIITNERQSVLDESKSLTTEIILSIKGEMIMSHLQELSEAEQELSRADAPLNINTDTLQDLLAETVMTEIRRAKLETLYNLPNEDSERD